METNEHSQHLTLRSDCGNNLFKLQGIMSWIEENLSKPQLSHEMKNIQKIIHDLKNSLNCTPFVTGHKERGEPDSQFFTHHPSLHTHTSCIPIKIGDNGQTPLQLVLGRRDNPTVPTFLPTSPVESSPSGPQLAISSIYFDFVFLSLSHTLSLQFLGLTL